MGGGVLRSVHRAVRGGGAIQESFSSNRNTIKHAKSCPENTCNATVLTLSSPSKPSPFTSPPRYRGASRSLVQEPDWEYVYGAGDKTGRDFTPTFDDSVFGNVPSLDEVQHALSVLQKVPINPNEEEDPGCGLDELDWIEPPYVHLCHSKALSHCEIGRAGGALDLFKNDPSVQKMVVSIASDDAVWKAVLNNEAVREFRNSINEDGEKTLTECSDDGSNPAKDIARWIVNQIQAKVNQLAEKIMMVFHEVFEPSEKTNEGESYPLEGKLRSSFFLSLIVVLMVLVTRAHAA